MAISGFTTSNDIRHVGTLGLSGYPLTMAAWVNVTTISPGATQVVGGLTITPNANDYRNHIYMSIINSSGLVGADSANASQATATSSSAVSTNTWTHCAAVFASATSRAAYKDGGNKGTNATNITWPASLARFGIGHDDGSTIGRNLQGRVAEFGVWDVALTDDEVAQLGRGMPPSVVRPENLIAYLPLIRDVYDASGNSFSIIGSLSAANHSRIYGAAI